MGPSRKYDGWLICLTLSLVASPKVTTRVLPRTRRRRQQPGSTRPRLRAESSEAASVAPGGSRAQGDDASTQGSDAKPSVGSSEDDKRNMVTSGIDVGPKTNPNSQVDYKGSGASRFSTDLLLADAGTTLREPTPADEAYSSRSGGASPRRSEHPATSRAEIHGRTPSTLGPLGPASTQS